MNREIINYLKQGRCTYDVCTRERVFVVPCGHHHDSNQNVGMYNETYIVSKSLSGKIPSTEVEYSVDMCRLL